MNNHLMERPLRFGRVASLAGAIGFYLCMAGCGHAGLATTDAKDSEQQPLSTGQAFERSSERTPREGLDPTGFDLETEGCHLSLTTDWNGLLSEPQKAFPIRLHPEKGYSVESVDFLPVHGGVVLLIEYGDGEDSAGCVQVVDFASGKVRWSLEVPAFNLRGMRQNGNLYVTGIGFVSCIDLDQGKYRWKKGGLYDQATGDFNFFEAIRVEGNKVIFVSTYPTKREEENRTPKTVRRRIIVDQSSGRVTKQ